MILFLEDWKRFNAQLHLKTRNKSALELAQKYKMMGVKNHSFFLALYDQDLVDIDPLSNNLSNEIKEKIKIECFRNPWYILREVYKSPGEDRLVQFNRSIVCIWFCFFNHITTTVTQPRQTGKTFGTNLALETCLNFLCTHTDISYLAKDDALRKKNIENIKEIYDNIPTYLNFRSKNDKNNTEEISVMKLSNNYKTYVPATSEKHAPKVGRGLSSPVIHIDEAPFTNYIADIAAAMLGSMGGKVEVARRKSQPYGLILTTTAGKKDEPSGKYIFDTFVNPAALWTEKFFDCDNNTHLKETIKRNSSNNTYPLIYACFNHRQVGKSDEWFIEQTFGKSQEDIDRDYLNIWTSGSISNPIDTIYLNKIKQNIRDYDFCSIEKIGNYIVRWYIREDIKDIFMKQKKVIVGIDPSEGIGRDDISFIGVEAETGGLVFAAEFNETNTLLFSQFLVSWLEQYENTTLIIERRSCGPGIIDNLLSMLPLKGIDPFKRLFNWVVNNPNNYQDKYQQYLQGLRRSPEVYDKCKGLFGFATSGGGETSRDSLYSNTLQLAVKRCNDRIMDRKLSQQLLDITVKNNRLDHASGKHDDLLVGWMLCHWFLTNAKNTINYGIDSTITLTNTLTSSKNNVKELTQEDVLQYSIERKLHNLIETLKSEENEIMIERYLLEIDSLQKQLRRTIGEVNNLDSIIDQIKKQKEIKTLKKESLVNKFKNFYM